MISGGAGSDTLSLIDTGSAAWTVPTAVISGVETVQIRNLNGIAGSAAVVETATVTFADVASGKTVVIDGITLTTTAAVTAADLASAYLGTTVTGITVSGTASGGYIAAAVSGNTAQITLTSTTTGNVTDLSASGTGALPSISVVQGANAVAAVSYTDTVSASGFVDATSFVSDVSSGPVSFTGLVAGQTATMRGNSVNTTGNFSVSSSSTAPVVNVVGGTTGGNLTITSAAASNVTINSNGAPLGSTGLPGTNTVGAVSTTGTATSTLTIAADSNLSMTSLSTSAQTVNVSGAATSVNFSNATVAAAITGSNLTTINASGLTAGGISLQLGTGLLSVTGGSGNDTIRTAAIDPSAVVDAGAGTDTLIIMTATDLDTALEAAQYRGFETVRTAAGSFNAALLPNTTAVQFTGGDSAVLSNLSAAQAASVQVRTNATTNTFALANSTGTGDLLSLTLGTGLGNSVDITTGLVANGFETINMRSSAASTASAGANSTSTVAAFTADSVTTINLTGTAFNLSNIATTNAVTINGAALTGDRTAVNPVGLTVAGNAVAGSTITGSAVRDSLTLGTVGSTYNAGAGNDLINSTVANLLTGTVYNNVDGGAGIDVLTITDGTTNNVSLIDNTFKQITNVEAIAATTTTGNQSIVTGGFFNTNFAAGVAFTLVSSTGNITLDTSTYGAAVTATVTTVGTAGTNGIATVTTGSGNDTITVTNATAGGGAVINAGAGDDIVTGGLDGDTITGGLGLDTLTGGGGTDTFVFTAGSSSTTATDVITDYAAGDVIDITPAATIVTNTSTGAGVATISSSGIATFNSADVTLTQKITAVEAAINNGATAAAGQSAAFQHLGDAYVFVSDGVDGVGSNDLLIRLVGLDLSNSASDVLTITTTGDTFFTFG